MTDFDLDRLGDMWRQDPDPAEIAALRRAADDIARNARRSQMIDAATALAVSVAVIVLAWSNPKLETIGIGAAAIAIMLYGSIRQRHLRKAELSSLTGSTEDMLHQSVARARATLKRIKLGFLTTPPAFAIGIIFGAALDSGSGSDLINHLIADARMPFVVAAVLIATIAGSGLYYYRMLKRTRAELDQLLSMLDAFEREQDDILS